MDGCMSGTLRVTRFAYCCELLKQDGPNRTIDGVLQAYAHVGELVGVGCLPSGPVTLSYARVVKLG